jgi:hypothetical protein
MKRLTYLFLLIGTLALFLTGCYSRNRYGYPDHRGGGYGYQSNQVEALAEDLKDATARLYDEVDDNSRYDSDREDYARDRLRDLHEEAKDFNDEVDDRRDPRDGRDEYRELLEAYSRARESMRILRADNDVYRDFERVSRIMGQLNRVYGYGQRDPYGYR